MLLATSIYNTFMKKIENCAKFLARNQLTFWSFLIFFFPCVNWTNGAQNRGESISNVFFLMSKIDNCHFFWGSTITNKNKSTISNNMFYGSLQRRKSVIIFYSFAWNSYLKTDGASQLILFSIRLPTNNSWKLNT